MPENSKFEIVYALQARKYEIQNSKFRVVKSASISLGLAIVSIISIVFDSFFWNIRSKARGVIYEKQGRHLI